MRFSEYQITTSMQAPNDADSINAALLTRAGYIRKTAAGVYSYLPLGQRVLRKIGDIVREEMNATGAHEVRMPALIPLQNWKTTGRENVDIGFRTMGANDREFILGWSHEEIVTPLMKEFVTSYRSLPVSVYQLQTKFRNEPRAKSGVLRGREFDMKDMYSFHASEADFLKYYDRVKEAYFNVYHRCGLKPYIVKASGGAFTDKTSHEYSVICPAGEDTIMVNKTQGTAENIEIAQAYVGKKNPEEEPVEMGKVAVEYSDGVTIAANAEQHGVPDWKILKTVVYKVDDGFVGIVIRGDLAVDTAKVAKYFNSKKVRSAQDADLEKLGLVKGFISPVENEKIPFIADESVATVINYVTGANEANQDYIGVNPGRDFTVKDTAEFAKLTQELFAAGSADEISLESAIEVGNIFQLGTFYTDAFDVQYADENNTQQPIIMGCYGIGITRLMGTVVEVFSDDEGIVWPKEIAPYQVHLVTIGNDEEVCEQADKLYKTLQTAGYEVIYDDRDERTGKKLNDADLLGMPVRIVLGKKSLAEGKFEWKLRTEAESQMLAEAELIEKLSEFYAG